MKLETNDDQLIIMAAFRYALGRRTYMVSVVVDFLIQQKEQLSANTKKRIVEEINYAIEHNLAGEELIDVPDWERVVEIFKEEN